MKYLKILGLLVALLAAVMAQQRREHGRDGAGRRHRGGAGPERHRTGKVNILNSTIAGNSVGASGTGGGLSIYNPTPGSVTVVNSTNNLSSDASCLFLDPGSKQNTPAQLGPLADNGGQTDTMALLEGSPAIDAGTNEGCAATDQRGVTRPQGPACDIGAYERLFTPPVPPSADLRLKVRPKPKKPLADGKLAFLIRVANRGPDAATGVVVKGTVPALAKRAIGPKVDGKRRCKLGKVRGGKRKLTCQLGSINVGKRKTVRVVVAPKHAGKLRTRARVRSVLPDPNLKNTRAAPRHRFATEKSLKRHTRVLFRAGLLGRLARCLLPNQYAAAFCGWTLLNGSRCSTSRPTMLATSCGCTRSS